MKIRDKWILRAMVVGAVASSLSHADIVLTIDATDMSAVTITATGAPAGVNNLVPAAPVTLEGVFSSFASGTYSEGALMAGAVFGGVTSFVWDGVPASDLTLTSSGGLGVVVFDTSTPAFTGSITYDWNGASITPGTSGDVLLGGLGTPAPVIGQWEAIPEPATLGLLGMFGGGIFAVRRFFLI